MILNNITNREVLSNLKALTRLNFLEDIYDILERQYEIYKEDILVDLEHTIDDVIYELQECIDVSEHTNMIESAEYQIELVNELKKLLFDDIEGAYDYENLLEYISQVGKDFRNKLKNYNYRFHIEMDKKYNNWNLLIIRNRNFKYDMSEHLLILK